jgi:hypothetical protein
VSEVWKLSFKDPRHSPATAGDSKSGERTFESESAFLTALKDAWQIGATEISATFPQGQVLNDAILRERYKQKA